MNQTADTTSLLSSEFMHQLEGLDVLSRKLLSGKLKGERRSKRRGQSVEFADYRNYVVGDDLRFIDWNIYARLERLFLKLFLEEEDLSMSILLDISASTDYGDPPKSLYMKRLAAALAYIGLVNYNRVSVHAIGTTISAERCNLRSRRKVQELFTFLTDLQPQGGTFLADACKRFALAHRGKGVCIIISDFFDKGGFENGLRYLAGGGYDLYAIQTLAPQEINPDLQGDLKLKDLEDGDLAEVSITAPLIKKYKENLNAYCGGVKEYVTRRGGSYLFTSTAVPFEKLVLNYLRERGLLG